jgi:serine/threonine protein kinase
MERELIVHRLAMGGEGGKGHPNITPFKGVVRGPDGSVHMILEQAKGGDLERVAGSVDFARNNGVLPPPAATALQQQFIRDAVAGLKELQAKNLTHHDIKSAAPIALERIDVQLDLVNQAIEQRVAELVK